MAPPKARRDRVRSLRLTRGEEVSIRAKAHAAGLSVSAFLRRSALGKRVRARRGQLDRDAIYQLSRIGNNLNQIARALNTLARGGGWVGGPPVAQERLAEVIEELHDLLDELTG